MARYVALLGSIIALVFSLIVFHTFDPQQTAMQFSENYAWVPSLNINYHLAVDGISMPFVMLNNFITVLVVLLVLK